MGRPRGRSLALGVAALAAAAALLACLRPETLVELENAERGTAVRARLRAGEVFSVVSQHSMYDAPVTEEFVATGGALRLVAVSSPSAAVREYFGLVAPGERHALERPLREIVFRIAAGAPQRLRLGGVERSFLELGDPGDRLVLRAVRRPALARWVAALADAGS